MSNPPFKENTEELYLIKNRFNNLQGEWLETLDDLATAKEETKTEDLFATIEYLTFCDQLGKAIYQDLKEIDSLLHALTSLKKKFQKNKSHLNFIEELFSEIEEFRGSMHKKIQNIDEEYPNLAEESLECAQNIIAKFADMLRNEKITPNLKTEVNQNLEKELFLQELRDSLESYRQAREDFISEVEINDIRKQGRIPEDLGEEKPEIDSILSQLDTAITACDTALLIKDIEE
jgi:hypothetical protein